MDLLALTALTDPDTPAGVLAIIAASDQAQNSPQHAGYLLAHPNTPDAVCADLEIPSALDLQATLTSPTLNDVSRRRVLAATDTAALAAALNPELAPVEPGVVDELARRMRSRDPQVALIVATCVMDHALAKPRHQVQALHLLAGDVSTAADISGNPHLPSRYLHAAAHHPTHLRALAAGCTGTGTTATFVREGLTQLADAYDAGDDPVALLVQQTAARVRSGTVKHTTAVAQTPDAGLADALYSQHRSGLMSAMIGSQGALVGTRVWRRAHVHSVSVTAPPVDLDPPTDLHVLRATWASTSDALSRVADVPAVMDPEVMRALVATLQRDVYAARDPSLLAGHIARFLLHPCTPRELLPALLADLRELEHAAGGASGQLGSVAHLTLALTRVGLEAITPALAHLPMPTAAALLQPQHAVSTSLAWRARKLVAPLWADTDASRTALALAPTFTGTFAELVATVAAISS